MAKGQNKRDPKRRQWRKVNTEDIEDANEDERRVNSLKQRSLSNSKKRKGGPDAGEDAEGKGDEVFTVDIKGSGEGISKRQRRILARQALFPVKAANIGLSATEELKVERAERRLEAAKKPKAICPGVFDLWLTAALPSKAEKPADTREFAAIRPRKYMPTSLPGTLHQKVGAAPAVIPAHEGQSTNPETGAYETLACTAAAAYIEKEREQEMLDRKIKPMTHELLDAKGSEVVQGLTDAQKVETFRKLSCRSQEDDALADELQEVVKDGPGRRKSQAQKNKLTKQRIFDEEMSQKQQQKKMEKAVGEVGFMLKELKAEEDMIKTRRKYKDTMKTEKLRLEKEEGVLPSKRRIGRTVFQERAMVVPDADAARKGLRGARLKGSAIHERMASICRRGLVADMPEATRSEQVRQSKVKARVKKSRKFISPLLRGSEGLLNKK